MGTAVNLITLQSHAAKSQLFVAVVRLVKEVKR